MRRIIKILITFIFITTGSLFLFLVENRVRVQMKNKAERTPAQERTVLQVEKLTKFTSSEVEINKSIFFLETGGLKFITTRQACVVESALLHHPDVRVFLLITGGNSSSINDLREDINLRSLLSYPNFKIRYIDNVAIFKKSPLWDWFVYSDWQAQKQRSHILRFALGLIFLFDYGGVVLSFSVLTVQRIPFNFIGECEDDVLTTDILSFPQKNQFLQYVLDDVQMQFREKLFSERSLTNYIYSFCKVESLRELEFQECRFLEARLLHPEVLCPIEKEKHWVLFDENRYELAKAKFESKEVKGIHLWLELSAGFKEWGSPTFKSAIYKLGNQHCPAVFSSATRTL
ncbi:lactosylceramide 4-alpha-galactosyltransferase isoform X2 [Eurytemora carolleeae]|uniref:lactosylceramide 4-alpha-galactosyltransferase isoform X2 n=1 Tax=Eurytemora carolleeae TaxID=1294199 RepID=UPI000C75FB28|nr:lactosylceramide 4-alpha-galactosyltransferase isoform X2 [Eurytemora carolleeae]|eukprot:XP_023327422.1 lactosylceramide 4-alpha-galactosyltransferase-like isoform X2 [Eurytemora affinis]